MTRLNQTDTIFKIFHIVFKINSTSSSPNERGVKTTREIEEKTLFEFSADQAKDLRDLLIKNCDSEQDIVEWFLVKEGIKYRIRRVLENDRAKWIYQKKTPDESGEDIEEELEIKTGAELFEIADGFNPEGVIRKTRFSLGKKFLKQLAGGNKHLKSWLKNYPEENGVHHIDIDMVETQKDKMLGRFEAEFKSIEGKFSFLWAGLVEQFQEFLSKNEIKTQETEKGQKKRAKKQFPEFKDTEFANPLRYYLNHDATTKELETIKDYLSMYARAVIASNDNDGAIDEQNRAA